MMVGRRNFHKGKEMIPDSNFLRAHLFTLSAFHAIVRLLIVGKIVPAYLKLLLIAIYTVVIPD